MATRRDIAGLRILITGAARGIGAASARRLAGSGARLAVVDIDVAGAQALAAELGGGALALRGDVRDLASLQSAAAAAVERFGGLDVVVANAGVAYGYAVADTPDEVDAVTVDINLLGVMRTVRATLPHLLKTRGQLVLIASLASQIQAPLLATYSATKAGVHAYGNSLRQELAPQGVAVTVAYFGFLDTDMGKLAGDSKAMTTMTGRLPGPLSRLWPVSIGVEALVRSIERRSRRAVAPPAVLPAILLPALHQAVSERIVRGRVGEAMATARGESLLRRGSTPGLTEGETAPPARRAI
jgi:NAD(P)-dependent dehydrogenase (short-subunit alcohol dehydrogenase family)